MPRNDQSHTRRDFLKTTLAAAAGLGLAGLETKAHSSPFQHAAAEDPPATHNMMIVGVKTAFISHLPMFDGLTEGGMEFASLHRRQVIMEATFVKAGRDVTSTYLLDRQSHPDEKMYTLEPADFVLGRVDPKGMALKKFRGNAIFRGHLERGGEAFIGKHNVPSFDVNVRNVVHFHKFDPKGKKPEKLEYLLFGKGQELFLAHFITLPDDFDQIVSVNVPNHGLTDAQLGRGLHVIVAGRHNTALTRMREKEKGAGELQLPGAAAKPLQIEVVREFYFEEGELANDPVLEATEEEKKSGFPD
jgi:TAT (twin-arginine translocation) pathway signal sequence